MTSEKKPRTAISLKLEILNALKEDKLTFAQLEKKTGINWKSLRNHAKELEFFECVKIEEKESHNLNSRPYKLVKIEKRGIEILKKKV